MQKSIKELQADLREYEYEHEVGAIGKEEFEKAKATIEKQIKDSNLIKIKVAVASMVDVLFNLGEIEANERTKALMQIKNAKSATELKGFVFKTAS